VVADRLLLDVSDGRRRHRESVQGVSRRNAKGGALTMNYGVMHEGDWMHCPITGARIEGTRAQMRQYARDMSFLGWHVRPKGKPTVGFDARPLQPSSNRQEGKK
jgi:hypothetical protein